MKKLNNDYRGIDKTTDVLSFKIDQFLDFKKRKKLLGELYIDYNKCVSQSRQFGHSFLREFIFLVLHGTLHLKDFDHVKPKERKLMEQLQDKIMLEVGIGR